MLYHVILCNIISYHIIDPDLQGRGDVLRVLALAILPPDGHGPHGADGALAPMRVQRERLGHHVGYLLAQGLQGQLRVRLDVAQLLCISIYLYICIYTYISIYIYIYIHISIITTYRICMYIYIYV